MRVRKLTLKTEHLAVLTGDELASAVGAAQSGLTCPVGDCLRDFPTVEQSCLGTCICYTDLC